MRRAGGTAEHREYRTRHDSALIERVYRWAHDRGALLSLDLQVGRTTLQDELPRIEKFLNGRMCTSASIPNSP